MRIRFLVAGGRPSIGLGAIAGLPSRLRAIERDRSNSADMEPLDHLYNGDRAEANAENPWLSDRPQITKSFDL